MNISRTLENWRKISRTVRHFCNSFSWEIQSVKVWWNLNLLEEHIKEKIIQQWFINLSFILLKLNDVLKLSFNHHLFLILQKYKLILQMSSSCEDFLHLLVSIQQLIKNAVMFCLYSFSLHHWESKIALAIEMHTLNAMINFVVDTTFLLQATAVFTKTHDSMCYDSSYASMLIAMLMTMLMTMFLTIVDRSSLDYRVVSKSTLFRVSLCSSESYR